MKRVKTEIKMESEKQLEERLEEVVRHWSAKERRVAEEHAQKLQQMAAVAAAEQHRAREEMEAQAKKRRKQHLEAVEAMEAKIAESHKFIGKLLEEKKEMEVTRNDIAAKMRLLMQTHCSETLQLLDKGVAEGLLKSDRPANAVGNTSVAALAASPLSPLTKLLQSESLATSKPFRPPKTGVGAFESPQSRYELFSPMKDSSSSSQRGSGSSTEHSTSDSGHAPSSSSSSSATVVPSMEDHAAENGHAAPSHLSGSHLTGPPTAFVYHQTKQTPAPPPPTSSSGKSEELQNFIRLLMGSSADPEGGASGTENPPSLDSEMERLLALVKGTEET